MKKENIKILIIPLLSIALVIAMIMALGGCFTVRLPAVGEEKTWTAENSSAITELEIKISAGEIKIELGDEFSLTSNLKYLSMTERAGRIVIEETEKNLKDYNGAFLTIYIPRDLTFASLDIDTGAGTFYAARLSADEVDFDFGAGDVNIVELNANREAEIEGGAGKIVIGGGRLADLKLFMGVGELDLTSEMTGGAELNLGVGEVNITMLGGENSYTVEMNKGIGSLTYNGENVSGGRFGNGDRYIEINGGVGSVNIQFE